LILWQPAAAQGYKCNGTCEPDSSSTTYQQTVATRTLVQNQRSVGPSPIRHANSTTQAANPGSSSYSYAIPVIHLPGRNGLDVNLTLYYNSHVWNTAPSSNALTLNADRDFPDYGFRLDYGYIESFTSGSSTTYILTESDGTKRTLALKSGTTTDWQSTDATSIDAFPVPTSNPTSILLLRRDGTQWQYVLGNGGTSTVFVPTQITDTNGNYISISYLPNPSPYNAKIKPQDIQSITDTLGRTITYNYENTDYKLLSISGPAPGSGTQNYISFTWGQKTLQYTFSGLTVDDSVPSGSQLNIITACTYPNGTGYSFTWGDWATISSIAQTSANGTVRNSVSYNFPAGTTPLNQPPTFTQETVFDGVNTSNWTYSTTYMSGVPGVVIATSVTDPYNTTTTTSYFDIYSTPAGLPSSTVVKSGATTLRTTALNWTSNAAGNPLVSSVTTTLNDSGQQFQQAYSYDPFYNVSQISEYDFGLGLVRTTQTDYATSGYAFSAHVLNLPSQVRVYAYAANSSNLVARTDFAYDTTPIASITGVTHHDDTRYAANTVSRGNLTQTTRYTNAAQASGPITRNFWYDMLGNLLTAQVDCCQQQQFVFSNTTAYAYPDSVIKGSGATSFVTGFTYDLNTGLLLSSTDPNQKTTNFQYDSSARLNLVTRPDNATISTSFNDSALSPSATTTSPLDSTHNVSQTTITDGAAHTLKTESVGGSVDLIVENQYDRSTSPEPHPAPVVQPPRPRAKEALQVPWPRPWRTPST